MKRVLIKTISLVLLMAFCPNTCCYGLAPALRTDTSEFKEVYTAASICRTIEQEGSLDSNSYLNDLLPKLKVLKKNYRNVSVAILPHEIVIEISDEGMAVRYFDPTKTNVITPYSDISTLETKVIGPRLNRQIIHRVKALPLLEDEVFKKRDITCQKIETIKTTFSGSLVPYEILERITEELETILSPDEFVVFHTDPVHGFEHALDVTKTVFKWVADYSLEVDKEALAIGAFMHDIKGLGSLGLKERLGHHIEGAEFVGKILENWHDSNWPTTRIDKVKHIIESHRGVPLGYKAKNYPKGYIDEGGVKLPKPNSLEAQLVRDADTYDQLLNQEKLIETTATYRQNHINEVGITAKYFDTKMYSNAGGEDVKIKERLKVILNYKERRLAKSTDIMEFLLGKLLENCDPEYYFIPEIKDLVRQNSSIFFMNFLKITKREIAKENGDFDRALKIIDEIVELAGIAKEDSPKWKAINVLHAEALKKAVAYPSAVIIGRYVIDHYRTVAKQGECPVSFNKVQNILSNEDFDRIFSSTDKENFVESFGDLIIFLLREEKEDSISILKNMVDKLISESQKHPTDIVATMTEFTGQLQMLCYETYSDTSFNGAELMCKLIKRFNGTNYDMSIITRISEVRRKLEYLQKEEMVESCNDTVESLRNKIDNFDAEVFNSGWAENTLSCVSAMVRNSVNTRLEVLEIKHEEAFEQIRKIHKSQRGITWGGESHAETTIDKKKGGASLYSGALIVDGRIKIISSQLRVKNFLRTAAVIDLMHHTGIGTRLLLSAIESVIKDGYPSVYWRVLYDNDASNDMSNKFRDFVLGRRTDERNYAQQIQQLRKAAQTVFELEKDAGVYCDQNSPTALDYGDPKLSYKYVTQFLTPKGKQEFIRRQGFNGEEVNLAIDIFDLIGVEGLKKVKQFISIDTKNRVEILHLSKEVVNILEKNKAWAYAPFYYDLIFNRKLTDDHVVFLKKVAEFLQKEGMHLTLKDLIERDLSSSYERVLVNQQGQVIMDFLAAREVYDVKSNRWMPVANEDALISVGPFDVTLVMGSMDEHVAKDGANIVKRLRKENPNMIVVTSGKWGNHPGDPGVFFDEQGKRIAEAEHFKRIMEALGVNVDITKDRSANTGENIQFSRNRLLKKGLRPKKILILQIPEAQLRAGRSMILQYPTQGQTLVSMGVEIVASYAPYIPDFSSMTYDLVLSKIHAVLAEIQCCRTYANKFMVPVEIPLKVLDAETKLGKKVVTKNQNTYVDKNKALVEDLLGEGKQNILVRVPVEAIESVGIDNIKGFLATFQEAPNCYVELYYMSGTGEVGESIYQKYGLEKKPLPKDFKRTRENTITLFPALKGEEINQSVIVSRLGSIDMTPENTILSPIGLQHDPAGLIRASILGLKMMDIARQIKEKGIDVTKDQAFKDKIQLEILEQLKNVCDADDLKNFNLIPDDIIALATGTINTIITALKKLIRLLPITPINAEELRQIYEHAKAVITAA